MYENKRQAPKKVDKTISPNSVDAERAVLGAILKDQEGISIVLENFNSPEHFYVPKHRIIFKAILSLYGKNEPADITTVSNELQKTTELESIGGRVYLVGLIEEIVSIANLKYHCDIVIEKSTLRKLINTTTEIITSCYAADLPVGDIINNAESHIFAISQSRMKQGFTSLRELMPDTLTDIEDLQSDDSSLIGTPSGFAEIDRMTNGVNNGDLIIVAGRPSMGKSSLVMNIAEHIAVDHKKTVGVFSLEMSKEALALRLLCGRARISQQRLRSREANKKLTDDEWQRLAKQGGFLAEAPIFIDDTPDLGGMEMLAKARRLKSQHNLGLVIVDYIQMMQMSGRHENRQQEMSAISRSMKIMAKELNVPVMACSQLSRNVESRPDKRPMLSDLRESGAIEQDADLVMFVYREEHYMAHIEKTDPKFQEVEGKAEVIIAKQRNGATGNIKLAFVKEFARFENLAPGYRELPPGVDGVSQQMPVPDNRDEEEPPPF